LRSGPVLFSFRSAAVAQLPSAGTAQLGSAGTARRPGFPDARFAGAPNRRQATSLSNLEAYCWWHHHVVLYERGWTLIVHPDGTSLATSPDGRTIHSHRPPRSPALSLIHC
jgi:hypothetical protein